MRFYFRIYIEVIDVLVRVGKVAPAWAKFIISVWILQLLLHDVWCLLAIPFVTFIQSSSKTTDLGSR